MILLTILSWKVTEIILVPTDFIFSFSKYWFVFISPRFKWELKTIITKLLKWTANSNIRIRCRLALQIQGVPQGRILINQFCRWREASVRFVCPQEHTTLWPCQGSTRGKAVHSKGSWEMEAGAAPLKVSGKWKWKSLSHVELFLTPHGLYSPWNSPGQNTGLGSLSLLQGIFPT